MLAYKCGITKSQFVNEMKLHQKLDQFIKGSYQVKNKGCAIGCGIMSINKLSKVQELTNNHSTYEKHLGIPEWLARAEDTIFEGVSVERSKLWPVEFSEAINVAADLNEVKVPFIIFILEQTLLIQQKNLKQNKAQSNVIKSCIRAIKQMIKAQRLGSEDLIRSAARYAARSAARYAAESAESTRSAARFAAESARYAAESTRYAAESAWYAAESTRYAAESAWYAARSAAEYTRFAAESVAYELYADKLLELLKECK